MLKAIMINKFKKFIEKNSLFSKSQMSAKKNKKRKR